MKLTFEDFLHNFCISLPQKPLDLQSLKAIPLKSFVDDKTFSSSDL